MLSETPSEDQAREVPVLELEAIEAFTEPVERHDDPEEVEA